MDARLRDFSLFSRPEVQARRISKLHEPKLNINKNADMDLSLLTECIRVINNPQARGYSFVQDLVNILFSYRELLNINNIAVVWNVLYSPSGTRKVYFFSNDQKFNLESIDTDALAAYKSHITSKDPGFIKYRKTLDFASSHIVALPINSSQQHNTDYWIRDGVVLLFSQTSVVDISNEQLSILYTVLNSRVPTTLSSDLYIEALKRLTTNKYYDSFTPNNLQSLEESLYTISNKADYNLSTSGLRHFSLWNVNDDSKILNKEFNINTFSDKPHGETNTYIKHDSKHFLAEILNETDFPQGSHIIGVLPFSKIKQSVKCVEYFNEIGITEDDFTVVVSFRKGEEKKIVCLYIHKFPYSIFVSSQLICNYVRILCDYTYSENIALQNKVFNQLINDAFECETEDAFYTMASKLLKKVNEATDCLIYMYNERRSLSLKNQIGSKQSSQSTNHSSILPPQYDENVQLKQWFTSILMDNSGKEFYEYPTNSDSKVKSALLVPVTVKSGRIMGYILLLNKSYNHSCESAFLNDIFLRNNYRLSKICGMVFSQYQRLRDSIHNRNYILQKLRHEIPSNTDAIKNGVNDIMAGVKEKPINYLFTIARNIELNISRIMLLADFFTTVDFPKERFAEKRIWVNVNHFLTSYIEMFRTEGSYRGINVYFTIDDPKMLINVSNYYLLAIVNIVTNAIRYSAMGTSVVIEVTKDSIIVSDIGIQITESDMEHIYDEGYRSKSARSVCEKGMGYGLYLSKMIIESHNSTISAQCSACIGENVFAQKVVYDYYQSLPTQAKRMDFIHNGLEPYEHSLSDKLVSSIAKATINPKYEKYINNNLELVDDWMNYNSDHNYVFIDMEDSIFTELVYEVIFKITI